jgi:long-chain acyl-CoA synthetase
MKGYRNMPEETALTLKEGWLHTGDIATMDEEGYFYIVDRKKDMIICGGCNVYPRDIDEVFYEHPKVKEACAIGIPHPTRGEAVKCCVVLKEGETATAEEMMEFCKGKLRKTRYLQAPHRGGIPRRLAQDQCGEDTKEGTSGRRGGKEKDLTAS